MESIIAVFRMTEVTPQTRIKIMVALGNAINAEYSMNLTEPLVYELVAQLDPESKELELLKPRMPKN